MGWTSYYRAPGQTDREHLQAEVCGSALEILDSATIRNTFYGAVRDNRTGEVWGLVVLQRRGRGDHNYYRKEIDETMGPCEDACPDRILDLLSPTDSEYAQEWRARCRANNAAKAARPKVDKGALVKFDHPLAFSNGATLDTFVWVKGSTFYANGQHYRITNWRSLAYSLPQHVNA